MTSDPLGDMLTRLRNGLMRRKAYVRTPASKLAKWTLDVLVEEGYLDGYERVRLGGPKYEFEVRLKYHRGEPAIKEIKRISKPGRRVYVSASEIPRVYNGLGISVISTSRGVLSGTKARLENMGGEALCSVY